MRAGVLGAGGIIAPAIVRDLAESEEVDDLVLLDIDAGRAEAVRAVHGGAKARVEAVDARADLAEHLAGIDVLVNSASYRVNIAAMRACLAAGSHYVDLGGLYHLTGDQLALSEEFEDAGLLALLGMGSSPGKTNVMAAKAAGAIGGAPDRIDVFAAGRDLDPPDGPSYPYAPRTLVDELTLAPMALRDGEPLELTPMEDGGEQEFGDPIGMAATIYTLHSEVRTFGDSFGCTDCTFRLSLSPAVLERVKDLVGAGDDEIEAAARAAVPASDKTVSVHMVFAEREGETAIARAVTRPMEEWGIGGGIVSTATPASAAVRMLARGDISARGALPPERCVEPNLLFEELEARNCKVTVEVSELR